MYKTPAHLLRQTLESILKPSKIDLELICIDDSPGAHSSMILKEFTEKDNRVRVLTNDHNRGVSYSRNRGIEAAQGKYIAFQDADDLAILEGYEQLLDFAQKYNLDAVRGTQLNFRGNPCNKPLNWASKLLKLRENKKVSKVILAWQSWSAYPGIYRKEIVEKIKFVPTTMNHYEDSLFNVKLITTVDNIGIVNVPIYQVVGHPNSAARCLPSLKTYMEYALAARAIAREVCGHVESHSKDILRYYARRSIFILFADRRARNIIRSKRLRKAFALSASLIATDVKGFLSFPLQFALTCVQLCPMALFGRGGLLWNFVKLCMKLDHFCTNN